MTFIPASAFGVGTSGIYHVGYVVGQHWLTAYSPIRNKVN